MNKTDLINEIAAKANLNKVQAYKREAGYSGSQGSEIQTGRRPGTLKIAFNGHNSFSRHLATIATAFLRNNVGA